METSTIRAAIIGAGGVARTQHAPGLARLDGVELVAVCDMDEKRAAELAGEYGARAYTDYQRMLEEVRPDIVHVCTPEAYHFEPVMAALEAGAHVFCEKVMAETVEKARAMVKRALELGRWLGVDYNYRFIPAFRKLKEIIDSGELGRIALINVYAHSYCMHHAIDLVRFLGGEIMDVAAMHTRWDRPGGRVAVTRWRSGLLSHSKRRTGSAPGKRRGSNPLRFTLHGSSRDHGPAGMRR